MHEHLLKTQKNIAKSSLVNRYWAGLLLAALIVITVFSQVTSNTGSDPRGTLLVSQAIIQHGTIRLDSYEKEFLDTFAHQLHKKNGHIYNYFPLGTALLSAPLVAIANALGYDMVRDETDTQLILTALLALLIIFILYRTARLYLQRIESLLLAGLCWFGSSLASTVGTALWSHNFAFLFSSTAIFLVIRDTRRPQGLFVPALIGSCLFLAYLCRPTLALLSPFLLLYYFIHDKKSSLVAASSLGLLLLGFMGWSQVEFSQILPDYYLPKRLEGGDFETAFYGNLLSPARGLLIYSPFIVLSLLLTLVMAPRNKALAKLSLITVVWPIIHLLSISQFPHWWAGWSFGARLMVDALPGLFLGLFSSIALLRERKRVACIALAVSGLLAIHINTYQALFNPYGMKWNVEPNVDHYPEYLFDWQYPQFLHTKSRHESRLAGFLGQKLPPFKGALNISYDSPQAIFYGFYTIEPGFRWTEGQEAHLSFVLENKALAGETLLTAGFLGTQQITISLNETQVYKGTFTGGEKEIRFNISPEALKNGLNTFTFYLPDAQKPPGNDPRILAMAFRKLSIQ